MNGPDRRFEPHARHPNTTLRHQAPAAYVSIPTRLLDDLRDSPAAVGVYGLIARLYLIYQAPIPLSTPDLQRYDPRMSRGAAIRALQRLARGGWLVEDRHSGHKTSYTPAWGLVGGAARPWSAAAAGMGRPRHVHTLRLDRRLLDTCLGKLSPHASHAAQVERYLTEPMLSLADVGAYGLALARHPVSAPSLACYGLLSADGVRPLPCDQDLLALASQRALLGEAGPALAPRGLDLLGCRLAPRARIEDRGQPIFFVSGDLIGSMIGAMIDPEDDREAASRPSVRDPHQQPANRKRSEEIQSDHKGDRSLPPLPPAQRSRGQKRGHGDGSEAIKASTERVNLPNDHIVEGQHACPLDHEYAALNVTSTLAAAMAPTIARLQELDVYPSIIRELADLPVEMVEAACELAQAQSALHNTAGWIVTVLRYAKLHGWEAARARWQRRQPGQVTAASIQAAIDKAKASGLFLYDVDCPPEGRSDCAELPSERQSSPADHTDAASSVVAFSEPAQGASAVVARRAKADAPAVPGGASPASVDGLALPVVAEARRGDAQLTACLRGALLAELGDSIDALASQLSVWHERTAMVVSCPAGVLELVERRLRGPIERMAQAAGLREVRIDGDPDAPARDATAGASSVLSAGTDQCGAWALPAP